MTILTLLLLLLLSAVKIKLISGETNLYDYPNPFLYQFPFPSPLKYSRYNDDQYYQIQNAMRNISIQFLIKQIYDENPLAPKGGCDLDTFIKRLNNGVHQILISDCVKPVLRVLPFGNNSIKNNCLITTANLKNGHIKGISLIQDIILSLSEIDFEGQFIYLIGGYPTPLSEEILWSAVPYAFKVFMFVTAAQYGCENVLWFDGQLFPINNLTPIFDSIETNGALLDHGTDYDAIDELNERFIFAATRTLLRNLTGVDVLKKSHIFTITMGLRVSLPLVHSFFDEFYAMVRRGTPFLSLFPEEYVFGAILYQPKYSSLHGLDPSLR